MDSGLGAVCKNDAAKDVTPSAARLEAERRGEAGILGTIHTLCG